VDLASKKVNFWLSQYAGLEKQALPAKEKYQFQSRDGLTITGYLTPGSKGAKSPLVVFPHGGPFARDDQHFDLWVQMLARRGYAVLQVNFRGSTGFSDSFEVAGYQEYGKAMQDDVYDAITWVKENKRADTNNMCLVGASYGGYVAQVAAFQKPKEFKCFISIAGISDLPDLVKSANFWRGSNLSTLETIGDINDESQLKDLQAHSSVNHLDEFSAPILLIHGEYDQVVKMAQSEDLYKALKKKGKKVEFIELEKGTHNVDNPENREIAFKAIDKFLHKYLD
jgi:dipeptidyl aminopeptidase/acylaminoacyl peptidase